MTAYQKLTIGFLLASVVTTLIGYSIHHPDRVGLCDITDRACVFSYPIFEVGQPLLWSGVALALTSFLLVFVSKEVFKTWMKFGIPYIVIALCVLVATPVYGNFSPGRELMSQLLGALFVALSLVVIVGKYAVLKVWGSRTGG